MGARGAVGTRTRRIMTQDLADIQLLRIDGMTCSHCEHSVTEALVALPEIAAVTADAAAGTARIEAVGALDLDRIDAAVTEAGYRLVR
ncbi:MAG: hypothetical protein CMH36_09525 [Microbacterium sp.]|jgi:copper chaperone|uniref:HMA domain-containing protein n=2 Tax=Microbacterium ginsengisoli TaxID=400772 RepID=A0A3C1KC60_9MICO|nr:hypothetical protein [Microbacterium sp.]HAN24242.1 hypothetical protein [Microbacterium ginsengisoli]